MYVKLDTISKIPKDLSCAIDDYINYLNTGETLSEDCYQTEILVNLNWCLREHLLPEKEISELKEYYVRGGIHKQPTI